MCAKKDHVVTGESGYTPLIALANNYFSVLEIFLVSLRKIFSSLKILRQAFVHQRLQRCGNLSNVDKGIMERGLKQKHWCKGFEDKPKSVNSEDVTIRQIQRDENACREHEPYYSSNTENLEN